MKRASEPIAIIGLALRFPQSDSLSTFSDHLLKGRSLIREVDPQRWSAKELRGNPRQGNKTESIWGGFIDDADCFDADFFNISPREAAWMDPQQRFALELAWHAIEDAGYRASALAGSQTGVYMGVCHWDYAELLEKHTDQLDAYTPTGIAYSIIANRLSYFFDFHGPSITNDTACAASLVSIYEAVQALRDGTCSHAIAGGVNLIWSPNHFVAFSKAGMLSKDGREKVFDQKADGYVRGEGGAVLLLKPLAQAQQDADPIHGVIREVGTNHGGRTNSLTITNPNAQADLIASVYRNAGVHPGQVQYIETHGTGTPLGDPIEVRGLKTAFEQFDNHAAAKCGLGSVKTNIGHLEGAAGVAGVIKVLAAMQAQQLPPLVNFTQQNDLIKLEGSPFHIVAKQTPWPRTADQPRMAGVSSFGFGGSNAHLLLEEAPQLETASLDGAVMVPLSAKTPERLQAYAARLLAFLEDHADFDQLANLAYTFQVGREPMAQRAAFCVSDVADLKAALAAFIAGQPLELKDQPLLQAWLAGDDVDWQQLHQEAQPRRIHLPVYPFERVRHWMEPMVAKDKVRPLHPLLHRNISTLREQAFETFLEADAFYFADHVVDGKRVLPGVATLEMMREAARLMGSSGVIHDLTWRKPVFAEQQRLKVMLEARDDERVRIAVCDPETGDVFASAVVFKDDSDQLENAPVLAKLAEGAAVSVNDCYTRLQTSGMQHGPAFQALDQIRRHDDGLWLRLTLPRRLHSSLDAYMLHPSMLDAALQAWVALDETNEPSTPMVPLGVQAVRTFAPCKKVMTAHVRYSAGGQQAQMIRLDVDLYDRKGAAICSMRGVTMRQMHAAQKQDIHPLRFTHERWTETPLNLGEARKPRIVLAGVEGIDGEALELAGNHSADRATAAYHQVRRMVIDAIKQRKEAAPILVLANGNVAETVLQPLVALFKCACRENPYFVGRVVRVDDDPQAQLPQMVDQEARQQDRYAYVRYTAKGKRQVLQATFAKLDESQAPSLSGVCWITGGLGGVGQQFARYAATRGAAKLVLSGRSPLDETKAAQLKQLRDEGLAVHYVACDTAHREACEATVAQITQAHGPIRTVIHAAGLVQDQLLINTNTEQQAEVFAAKVRGTQYLDGALREQPLEHFWLTSSVASLYGNVGQSDYAAANAFLDAFAATRNATNEGRCLAIQWPLWRDGGMQVDVAGLKALRRSFGTEPLPTEQAYAALDQLALSDADGMAVNYGDAQVLEQALHYFATRQQPEIAAPSTSNVAEKVLKKHTLTWLKEVFADAVQTEPERIKSRQKLETYGFDSIVIVDVTQRLEEALGSMPMTLFFEYVDLDGVASYLMKEHRAALEKHLGLDQKISEPQEPIAEKPSEATKPRVEASNNKDIAVIGMAFRYPKADSPQAFWDMLAAGDHAFEAFPQERWNHAALYHPERDILGKSTVQNGAFIDDIDKFDPRYFHISQYEAELMAPEVRLFLQKSVEAFEDAGYSKETLQRQYGGDVGVLVGSMNNEYDFYGFQNMLLRGGPASGSYMGTIPNMVSYFYGFTGPSYFLTTMCSAASVCVHEAVQMLRTGRCQVALAGGISLLLHPQKLIATSQEHFTTKTATVIRGYGEGADGTILGEGVNAVVLKPLDKAMADGDRIYGVIKGTGVSNAGVRNGFTVPTPAMQQAAIAAALDDAQVDARSISYFEGHGSGTSLGDPIEIRAAAAAFAAHTSDTQFCPIGTVKSNIAHLLAASGLAGVTKVLLQLQQQMLVPSLHASPTNPAIAFERTPFYVQDKLKAWRRPQNAAGETLPRRAGITSIGAGGVNAHIIVEEAPQLAARAAVKGTQLLPFSVMNGERLQLWLHGVLTHLETESPDLDDLAFTLQVGRNALPCRLVVLADSLEDLQAKLRAFLSEAQATDAVFFNADILQSELDVEPEQVGDALAYRQLEQVAYYWVNGVDCDWSLLMRERAPRRVALPTYPFEKVRCWYPEQPDAPSVIHPLARALKLHPFIGSNQSSHLGLHFETKLHYADVLDYCYQEGRAKKLLSTFVLDTALAAAKLAELPGDWAIAAATIESNIALDGATLRIELQPKDAGYAVVFNTGDATIARISLVQQPSETRLKVTPPTNAVTQNEAQIHTVLKALKLNFAPYGESLVGTLQTEDGTHWFRMRQPQLQQDSFKQRVSLPHHWLHALQQALSLVQRTPINVSHSAAVQVFAGEAAWLQLVPNTEGYDVCLWDDQGHLVAAFAQVTLSGAKAATQPTRSQSDQALDTLLRGFAADLLKFDPESVDLNTPFYDFGFDSISLAKLTDQINDALDSNLTPAVFFECQNLAELARNIQNKGYAVRQVAAVTPTVAIKAQPVYQPQTPKQEGVAIVGLYAQLPGAGDLEQVWRKLLAGEDLVGDFPMTRFSAHDQERLRNSGMTLKGGFLSDIDTFDAAHFKISPAEARLMDPQARLALSAAWHALHDAGEKLDQLPQDTAVYFGVTGKDYLSLLQDQNLASEGFAATGNSHAMLANRISFHLNINGPSEPIDTACSSSLIALHRAADQIRAGRSKMAVVGGVNLNVNVDNFLGPFGAGMLSPSGKCQTFAAQADGYVRGEGVVCLILKDLAAAERDGNRIWGLLRGSAENHGGRASSLTAPNGNAQTALIEQAMAPMDASRVQYVETHGTGTALGDPVEINALKAAFEKLGYQGAPQAVALGSIKSQIGHLEAAAGLASVAKVLLGFRDQVMPPTLHCAEVNPYIDLKDSPFVVARERWDWPTLQDASGRPLPRRAAVSSFGFGGANAHAILEAYAGAQRVTKGMQNKRFPFQPQRYWFEARNIALEIISQPHADGLLCFEPIWQARELGTQQQTTFEHRIVYGVGLPDAHALTSEGASLAERYTSAACDLAQRLQQVMKAASTQTTLVQVVIAQEDWQPWLGLGAMLESAASEAPHLSVQLLVITPAQLQEWQKLTDQEAAHASDHYVTYMDEGRSIRTWRELTPPAPGPQHSDGCIVITGGLGGLGLKLARHLAQQDAKRPLILLGRRPLDTELRGRLKQLQDEGIRAFYRVANLTDPDALADLWQEWQLVFTKVAAVFHCAAHTQDGYLIHHRDQALRDVFEAKVHGSQALATLCQQQGTRLIGFSSLGGAVGNPGQANYAAANGFMDGLCQTHNQLAINWPFWAEGGLALDVASQQRLFDQMGQRPLPNELGFACLDQLLGHNGQQVVVVYGEPQRIRAFFANAHRQQAQPSRKPRQVSVYAALLQLFAKVSGHQPATIQADVPLEHYGIDSLMITRLNRELDELLGPLSKTLFYEFQTLGEVAAHLERTQNCAGLTAVAPTTATPTSEENAAIAIIGISGQYPCAADLNAFAELLAQGQDAVGSIPQDRWSLDDFFEADPKRAAANGKSYTTSGAFLEGFADFDPDYFKISRREAAAIDPQERLFLQAATHAFENAGYPRHRLIHDCAAQVGVFAGVTKSGFAWHPPFQTAQGAWVKPRTSFSSIANRVSYFFGLQGPSLPIDTMCSSSLTAIHTACEALRKGDCRMALAGGVNLYLHRDNYVELCASHMLSPSGRCHSFGAAADGFVPGEGVGCVVLKPLAEAERDGDAIIAVIRGSAINHGGKTNGYTVPNPKAQAALIRKAMQQAGVSTGDIGLIEAHGTGTVLGDPIEVTGLTEAFREDTDATGFCALSTVKANIGHLEAAAGIAGLTRVLAQMQRGQLFPTLHCHPINPNLNLSQSPFRLIQQTEPWPKAKLAGISSFGAGGSNAHVIVERYAHRSETPETTGPHLIPLAANDEAGLKRCAQQVLHVLGEQKPSTTKVDADWVCASLADMLAVPVDAIDANDSFADYGLSPIQVGNLTAAIAAKFAVEITPEAAEQAASLAALVDALSAPSSSVSLTDLAYTLQVGREPLATRVAVIATSARELQAALQAFIDGQAHPQLMAIASDVNDIDIDASWRNQQFHELAQFWVSGGMVRWQQFERAQQPNLLNLPYPFAKERFWLGQERAQQPSSLLQLSQALEHELAHLTSAVLQDVQTNQVTAFFKPWFETVQQWQVAEVPAIDTAWQRWQHFKANSETGRVLAAQLALAETTLHHMPQIVTGKLDPLTLMFPNGSHAKIEAVYKDQPIATHFNKVLADQVIAAIKAALQQQTTVRILEIGAGTGGTSAYLFEQLKPYAANIETYCFTDISKSFINQAKRKYVSATPYMSFAICNAEKPLHDQDIELGSYDIVIAANVLHATRNIQQTLMNVRQALKPQGRLILNEMSLHSLFGHLTFGLLEGWWRFDDPEVRLPGGPALSGERWLEVMREAGFVGGELPRREDHPLGQMVVVGIADQMQPVGATKPQPVAQAEAVQAVVQAPVAGDRPSPILAALGRVLDMPPERIQLRKSFADYGLDSILGIELVHQLNDALGLELETTCLFDYHNVILLEAHIAEQLGPQVVATAQVTQAHVNEREPIAIIGMSGRFAESDDCEQWWQHLVQGRDLVREVDRWNLKADFADLPDGSYCKHGSFLKDIDRFDPLFFNISGLEATYMDPQQRIFLEEAWKTLEDAGHAGADVLGSRTGVFVGCSSGDYQELFTGRPPGQAFWGNTSSLIPARIAYFLDLKGPALAIDTACSSSLTAVHAACRSIWNGESDMALAGGVFVQTTPRFYRYANGANMLSVSGRCAAFDASANGIVPGEAAAAVMLRPLSQAQAAGDHIYAVIETVGINQDGATNGITAPSAQSQERLIRETYASGNIDAATISLVEAHGTGTPLGDPIEFAALTRAFRKDSDAQGYCSLGSVKANMGHATTAAGIAGLVKTLLALKHRTIPPLCHLQDTNPEMKLAGSPFVFDQQAKPWQPMAGAPRRAAVSSFGFSGTNAHLVLREPDAVNDTRAEAHGQFVALFSGRTAQAVRSIAEAFAAWLPQQTALRCDDLAFTLMAGRRHMIHRMAVVFEDLAGLVKSLQRWLAEGADAAVTVGELSDTGDVPQTANANVQDITKLAAAYCEGSDLPVAELFEAGTVRRVSLPTYRFAKDRYWVKAAPQSVATTSVKPAERPLSERNDGGKVVLLPPQTFDAFPKAQNKPIKLAALQAEPKAAPPLDVTLEDAVCVIRWDQASDDSLTRALAAQNKNEHLKLIVLQGVFNGLTRTELPLNCGLPVIALPTANLQNQSLLFALMCDFLLLDEACDMRWQLPANPATQQLFTKRLGVRSANHLLSGKPLNAKAAQQLGCPIACFPQSGLQQALREWQASLSDAPRVALTALKAHLRRNESRWKFDHAPSKAGQPHQRSFDDVTVTFSGTAYTVTVRGPRGFDAAWQHMQQQPAWVRVALCSDADGSLLSKALLAHQVIVKSSARYHWQTSLDEATATHARHHLGEALIARFVLSGASWSGSDLAAASAGIEATEDPASLDTQLTSWANIHALPKLQPSPQRLTFTPAQAQQPQALPLTSPLIQASAYSNGVVHVTMKDQTSKNSFTNDLMDGLQEVFALLAEPQRGYKAVVLSGFESYFASGGTRDGLQSLQQGNTRFTDRKIYSLPAACPIPVIAAMQGHGIGAGWSMGFFCDLALMSQSHVYHSNYLWFGFTPGAGATLVVPQQLGDVLGREVLFNAKPYKGRELQARAPQLPIYPAASVVEQTLAIAQQMAGLSRAALVDLKRTLQQARNTQLSDILARELAMHQHTFIGSKHVAERIETLFSEQHNTPAKATISPAQTRDIRHPLVTSLAEELMIPAAEIRDCASFLDLGLDSILASTWVQQLNQQFGTDLVATDVYAYPTLADLIPYIREQIPGEVETPAAKVDEQQSTQVLTMLAEELMIPVSDIRADAKFLDLGLDSILALTWVQRINDAFGWELTATQVYAYPTVGEFMQFIGGQASAAPVLATEPQAAEKKPSASVDDSAVLTQIMQSLASELMLRDDEIPANGKFLDLGLDSILALTWVRHLNERFAIDLQATVVYTYPTVAELANHIATLQPTLAAAPELAPKVPEPVAPKPAVTPQKAKSQVQVTAATQTQPPRVEDRRIAVIGMAGRFPKAQDLEAFWQNIVAGRDCIDEVPPSRFDINTFYDPDPQAEGKTYCKWMGSLDEVDQFDPFFFNMTPREAELSDPQQRLFLQAAWHCIESAGYDPRALSGSKCGVFVGCGPSGYENLIEDQNAYSLIGGAGSILSARIAYLLNLKGPSIALDTACSSSLVAIAQACNSLILGESDIALAGGVSVLIGPSMHVGTSKVSMLSKDGRCFSFDGRANGFVPGEGVGTVMLKRLDQAIADGDPIRAVISGWGVNQDGKTNGITAPNPLSQASLEEEVYRKFAIDPETIELVEAHGTGTPLGDPIEIEGLATAFKAFTDKRQYCAIGSVKSNVGHLLASAGVAGFIKAAYAVERATLPTTANFNELNPLIKLEKTPFTISTTSKPWPSSSPVRRAAVSSFGFSGTNAHLVLESYAPVASPPSAKPQHFLLSAASHEQLKTYAANMAVWLANQRDGNPAHVAFTSQVGRTPLKHRLTATFETLDRLSEQLRQFAAVGGAPQMKTAVYVEPNTPTLDPKDAAALEAALQACDHQQLAELWLRGITVPWQQAWPKGQRRVAMPTYPFAKMRCWVKAKQVAQVTQAAQSLNVIQVIKAADGSAYDIQFNQPPLAHGFYLPQAVLLAAQAEGIATCTCMANLIWSATQADRLRLAFYRNGKGVLVNVHDPQSAEVPVHLGTLLQGPAQNIPSKAHTAHLPPLSLPQHLASHIKDARGDGHLLSGMCAINGEGLLPPQVFQLAQQLAAWQQGNVEAKLFAIKQLYFQGRAPQSAELLFERCGSDRDASFNLSFYHATGEPWLRIEGLLIKATQPALSLAST